MEIRLPDDKFSTHTIILEPKEISDERIKQQAHELYKFLFNDTPSLFFKQLKKEFIENVEPEAPVEAWFAEFYNNYPRKVGKHKAWLSFKRLCKSASTLGKIMDGLAKYRAKWTKEGTEKEFIPHPSTWLNQKRWEDEEIQKVTLNEALSDMERLFGKT